MIASYLKKRNIAAIVYVVGMAALAVRAKVFGFSQDDWVNLSLLLVTAVGLISASAFYLRAKGRSDAWLFLLRPINVIALLVYWSLEDQSDGERNAWSR